MQKTNGIKYISPSDKTHGERTQRKGIPGECEKKAQELLSYVPIEKRGLALSETDSRFYMAELLAYLMEFHIREDKPGWWSYFEHFKKDDEEKFEDRHTIASCQFIKNTGMKCQIKFEREQEIGFEVGDEVLVLENEDTRESYKILELDLINGRLVLDLSKCNAIPKKQSFTLTSKINDFYKINILKSLLETANRFSFNTNNFSSRNQVVSATLLKVF